MINMMELKLNKQIFDGFAIETAISAYKGLATIDLLDGIDHWICSFSDCEYPEKLTALEFENYVIDLMNSKHYDDN